MINTKVEHQKSIMKLYFNLIYDQTYNSEIYKNK